MNNAVRAATTRDWTEFLAAARAEGWRVPLLEQYLLREHFPAAAWAIVENHQWCGFVTAVAHGKSGWIGNLLVAPARRRAGIGLTLFDFAVQRLEQQGVSTLWLTASAHGAPLYRRRGFLEYGTIVRWVRPAGDWVQEVPPGVSVAQCLFAADSRVWGGERRILLESLSRCGRGLTVGGSVALLQGGEDLQLIGPWLTAAAATKDAAALLAHACRQARPELELVVDLVANRSLEQQLAAHGFLRAGSNLLMARGPVEGEGLATLTALASLGSIG